MSKDIVSEFKITLKVFGSWVNTVAPGANWIYSRVLLDLCKRDLICLKGEKDNCIAKM
jgi:hypothetical protein